MDEPRSHNIEGDPSPFYVKELFVDFCLRDKQEDYFSEAIGPKDSLEAMSMLDSGALKGLEPGASLYCGPDLLDALHHEVSSASKENWLRNRIASYLQDVPFRNQVGVRLDDELNAIGLGHLTGLKTGMKAKVTIYICVCDVVVTNHKISGRNTRKISSQAEQVKGRTT